MTSYPHWETLVARLEADLQARESPSRSVLTDDDAWETLASILRTRAQVLIAHSILQPEDSADLVQNLLLKLQSAETMRRLRAARSPEGYIVVMLRNAANDLARRRQLEKTVFQPFDEESSASEPAAQPPYAIKIEEASIIRQAVESLNEAEKELLGMRFWSGLSIGEIAKELDISYSAAAVKLFRILARIREHLEPSKG